MDIPFIINELLNLHPTEIGAVVFALLYLYLAARESVWCWVFGIISCALWAYAAFALYNLYIDGFLQIFYVGISFMGIYQWQYGAADQTELPITLLKPNDYLKIILFGVAATWAIGYLFARYTPTAMPYLDAFTTIFSIIATFLVIWKKLDNWWFWLIIDSAYIYLYYTREAYLFVLLFIIYILLVVIGFYNWLNKYQASKKMVHQ